MFSGHEPDRPVEERFRLSPAEKHKIEAIIFAQLRDAFPEVSSDNKQLLVNEYQQQKRFRLNFSQIDAACGIENTVSKEPASRSYFLKVIVPGAQKNITPDIADALKKFTRLYLDEILNKRQIGVRNPDELRKMQAQIQKQILQELGMTKFNCNYVQA